MKLTGTRVIAMQEGLEGPKQDQGLKLTRPRRGKTCNFQTKARPRPTKARTVGQGKDSISLYRYIYYISYVYINKSFEKQLKTSRSSTLTANLRSKKNRMGIKSKTNYTIML